MDEVTRNQLLEFAYSDPVQQHRERPILVCDVDEVVLHLVDPFEQILSEHGYHLKHHTFRLSGNIFHRQTGEEPDPLQIRTWLDIVFREQNTRQAVVEGVTPALQELSADLDILFLTNLPHDYRDIRRSYLADSGLDHPLVTNTGSKVGAIKLLADHHPAGTGFIDDTPPNLHQVREALPEVKLFHFMAHDGFRQAAGNIEGSHISTGDWREATASIRSVLLEDTAYDDRAQ